MLSNSSNATIFFFVYFEDWRELTNPAFCKIVGWGNSSKEEEAWGLAARNAENASRYNGCLMHKSG